MAEQIDILTYTACWIGALLLTAGYGAVIVLLSEWRRRRKKNETR